MRWDNIILKLHYSLCINCVTLKGHLVSIWTVSSWKGLLPPLNLCHPERASCFHLKCVTMKGLLSLIELCHPKRACFLHLICFMIKGPLASIWTVSHWKGIFSSIWSVTLKRYLASISTVSSWKGLLDLNSGYQITSQMASGQEPVFCRFDNHIKLFITFNFKASE